VTRYAAALSGLLLLACSSGKGLDTAAKLATALKNQGVAWTSSGPVERARVRPKRVVNEAVLLEGENLRIEVYRVEDEQWFKTAAVSLLLRRSYEAEDSENALVDVLARHPFLVAVVEEPAERQVREAIGRIFPKDEQSR
jgi:RecB family endonuclease NucS